jgi:hypothetical protein
MIAGLIVIAAKGFLACLYLNLHRAGGDEMGDPQAGCDDDARLTR